MQDYQKRFHLHLQDKKKCDIVFKALANSKRRDILILLAKKGPLSIQNIAFHLDLPISSVSEDVSMLLKTGLVSVIKKDKDRGQSKIISRQFEFLDVDLVGEEISSNKENEIIEVLIGSYSSFNIHQLCGMLSSEGYIGARDDYSCFYESKRFEAQLIWFDYGYLKYEIPFKSDEAGSIESISFTLELCSEAPGYNEDWPSDIYFEVNDLDIGYFTSLGDFGERNGRYSPSWWKDSTSYGILKNIHINHEGSFIDGKKTSNVTIDDLKLKNRKTISFKLGVKEDAKNRGGLNLFGSKFGDYDQHIVLTISHK